MEQNSSNEFKKFLLLESIDKNIRAIKGWVKFFGILTIIGIIIGISTVVNSF